MNHGLKRWALTLVYLVILGGIAYAGPASILTLLRYFTAAARASDGSRLLWLKETFAETVLLMRR